MPMHTAGGKICFIHYFVALPQMHPEIMSSKWAGLFLVTWYKLESPGKTEPQLSSCLHYVCLWTCLQGIFLIAIILQINMEGDRRMNSSGLFSWNPKKFSRSYPWFSLYFQTTSCIFKKRVILFQRKTNSDLVFYVLWNVHSTPVVAK